MSRPSDYDNFDEVYGNLKPVREMGAPEQAPAPIDPNQMISNIREIVKGYYLALDGKENREIAAQRALEQIQRSLDMVRVQDASLNAAGPSRVALTDTQATDDD